MHLLLLTWVVMALTAAQPSCDPQTQYERNGQCCDMCGPGTRMTSMSTCSDPQCRECEEREYQDKHTNAVKCERQPYCDQNKNFEVAVHQSKTKRTVCMCKLGFHCSSEECITCVAHTVCEPGYGAQPKGNHTHDTVCKRCADGFFSNESSWDGACGMWTVCKSGYYIEQSGKSVHDNTCVNIRHYIIWICVLLLLVVIIAAIAGFVLCKVKLGCFKRSAKGIYNLGQNEDNLMPVEVITCVPSTPEENDDDPRYQTSPDVLFSEGGNLVTEENGKSEITSQEETQSQTLNLSF
ncbi:tumor necrosis factor receptor superfamily member 5 [Brachyistius frenatus]|uniref:tumor necrosis factor receptor superfamily member 5 n=1 Tax=Brachyistius frenatus TaxID=100188 RepID=UPI0037E7A301